MKIALYYQSTSDKLPFPVQLAATVSSRGRCGAFVKAGEFPRTPKKEPTAVLVPHPPALDTVNKHNSTLFTHKTSSAGLSVMFCDLLSDPSPKKQKNKKKCFYLPKPADKPAVLLCAMMNDVTLTSLQSKITIRLLLNMISNTQEVI